MTGFLSVFIFSCLRWLCRPAAVGANGSIGAGGAKSLHINVTNCYSFYYSKIT